MRDSQHKDIDQQFVDLGWEKMRALLDSDLPVAAPVLPIWRRYAVAAILLLILSSAAIGWWMLSQKEGARETNQTVEVDTPGLQDPAPEQLQPEANRAVIPDEAATEDHSRATAEPIAGTTPPVIKKANGATAAPSLPEAGTPIIKDKIEKEVAVSFIENTTVEKTGPETAEPSTGEPSEDIVKAPAIISALAGIKTLEPAAFEIPRPSLEVNFASNTSNRVHVGLEGVVMAASGVVPSGGGFGVRAFRQFGVSRWAAGAGLYFSSVAQELVIVKDSQLETAANKESLGANQGGSNPAAVPNVPTAIDTRFQYLSLPLVAQHHLNRHFRVEGGMQVNYLLAASELQAGSADRAVADVGANPIGPASPSFNLDSFAPETYRLLSTNTPGMGITTDRMNALDLSLTGGVTYLPFPRLGINLRYSFGLVDIVKSPDYQSYNRWLHLGLRYYLR